MPLPIFYLLDGAVIISCLLTIGVSTINENVVHSLLGEAVTEWKTTGYDKVDLGQPVCGCRKQ